MLGAGLVGDRSASCVALQPGAPGHRVWALRTGLDAGHAGRRGDRRLVAAARGGARRPGRRAPASGLAIPLVAGWYLRGFGWTGAVGALAVAAVGAAVTRWFGPRSRSVRFALLAMALLLFFRWIGL